MSTAEKELRSRNLRMLAVLAGLFLLPLAIAFWMYYGTDWRPAKRVNHGELIIPARPLPHPELFHEMKRVERVFLVTSGCCDHEFLAREQAGLIILNASDPAVNAVLNLFPTDLREQSVFIVDPLGNLMMRYDVRQNPKGLLEDLKKLLTLSHIG